MSACEVTTRVIQAYAAVELFVEVEPVGDVTLKGLSRPAKVFNLIRLTGS